MNLEQLTELLTKTAKSKEKSKIQNRITLFKKNQKNPKKEKVVEEAIKGDDVEAIQTAATKLLETAAPIIAATQGPAPEVQPGEQTTESQDGVVDAEFTEVKKDSE